LKEETVDRSVWRTLFRRFYGLVADRLRDGDVDGDYDDDDSYSLCSLDLLDLLFISATIFLIAFCGKRIVA